MNEHGRLLLGHHSTMRSAVVVDIDGVLCNNVPRQQAWIRERGEQIVGRDSQMWEEFNAGLGDDPCFEQWVVLTQLIDRDTTVILLTCRGEQYRAVTERWLRHHGVCYNELRMWDETQHGYYEHKEVAIADIASQYRVKLVIEDSAKHCEMFREAGYQVIQVPGGLVPDAEAHLS